MSQQFAWHISYINVLSSSSLIQIGKVLKYSKHWASHFLCDGYTSLLKMMIRLWQSNYSLSFLVLACQPFPAIIIIVRSVLFNVLFGTSKGEEKEDFQWWRVGSGIWPAFNFNGCSWDFHNTVKLKRKSFFETWALVQTRACPMARFWNFIRVHKVDNWQLPLQKPSLDKRVIETIADDGEIEVLEVFTTLEPPAGYMHRDMVLWNIWKSTSKSMSSHKQFLHTQSERQEGTSVKISLLARIVFDSWQSICNATLRTAVRQRVRFPHFQVNKRLRLQF